MVTGFDEGAGRFFGIVVFDDPLNPGTGWCCRTRPEMYKRISGPSELPTDTVWWTNVAYETFFRKTEIWRQPSLRHKQYVVTTPENVLAEWGYEVNGLSIEFGARFLAQAFDRIMQLAWMLVREVKPKARMSDVFVNKTLREDLRVCLPQLEYPKGEAASVIRAGQAYEEFTPTGAKGQRGAKVMVLRRPRVEYALEMMQTPVPKGPYEFLDRKALRAKGPDPVRYVLDADDPMMVDVSVTIQPEVASIYGFGASTDKNKRVPRSWVAHPEFIALARIADIQVRGIWKAGEYWGLVEDLPDPVRDFLTSPFSLMSWSAGVVAETLWRSVALAEDKSKTPLGPNEERAGVSWQGVWMKGADKTAMFMASLRLAELGYCVMSYGLGWVRCLVPEEDAEDFVRDGLSLGFLPNLQQVPGSFKGRVPWGGTPVTRPFSHMVMTKNFKALWNLDVVPLQPTEERRKAAMRKVKESMMARPAA